MGEDGETPGPGSPLTIPVSEDVRNRLRKLAALEAQLAQRELELATIRAELYAFEGRYYASVGFLQAELEDLEAQIAAARAILNPSDPDLAEEASSAKQRARESAAQGEHVRDSLAQRQLPTEELKSLFRKVARAVHPDLAEDLSELELRQRLMAEANDAYARGDADALRAVLAMWKRRECHRGTVQPEVEALDRTIARVQERLREIEHGILQLKKSPIYQLKLSAEQAEAVGRDLLAELAVSVSARIEDAYACLASLKGS